MESLYEFVEFYLPSFEEVLGIKLGNYSSSSKVSLKAIDIPNIISEINPKSIENVLRPLEDLLEKEFPLIKDSEENSLYKHILITKYIYKILEVPVSINSIDSFFEDIKSLSSLTYEQDHCKMGFILFTNKDEDIKGELAKLKLEFIKFDEVVPVKSIKENKQTIKLVDSLSLCYILNHNLEVVGLGKKIINGSSISALMANRFDVDDASSLRYNMYKYFVNSNDHRQFNNAIQDFKAQINKLESEIKKLDPIVQSTLLKETERKSDELSEILASMLEQQRDHLQDQVNGYHEINSSKRSKANRNIQYINFNAGKIQWYKNDNLICDYQNGKWTIKNSELILQIISEYLMRQYTFDGQITSRKFIETLNRIIPRVKILFDHLKSLSKNNIGALIIILKKSTKQNKTIFKDLLSKQSLSDSEYIKIIRTTKNHPLNIYSCDKYLFESIASIDGSIILDKNFQILSYGEMVNNSIIDANSHQEKGARTAAALNSSVFGLSIKVSEDGDISIFEDGKSLIKL
ncbi:hypothetical protein ACWNS2_16540 [Planococcus plakortidis]